MGEELKFQRLWEFRRGNSDFDSSTDDCKSSLGGEPACSKSTLVSCMVPVGKDETSKASRFQQKGNNEPCISGQFEIGKAEKGKERTSKKDNEDNEKKRGSRSRKKVPQKKSKTTANGGAALDDLNNYMNSLLEELKVTRKNLLSWMREEMEKLMAEEKASESESEEIKTQLQHQNNLKDNAQVQCQNILGKDIQVQHPSFFDECGQGNHQSKFEENAHLQDLTNLEDNPGVMSQKNSKEKAQLQRQKRARSCPGTRNSNGISFERFGNKKKSADSNNFTPALEDQVDYSQEIVLATPSDENGEARVAFSEKSKSKSGTSDQNEQVQQQKSIVLALRAQKCNSRSPVKNAKGKKAANSNNHRQVPNNQVDYNQAIESIASAERDKGERSGFYVEPNFSSDSFNQVASSMYLTIPSVLTKAPILNHRPDTSSFSYMQPRIVQNQIGINSERSNLIMSSTSHLGYFQGMQPEESRYYGQMSSRDIGWFNQNDTTSSIVGSGFTVPLQAVSGGFSIPTQFDSENPPRENNNTLGLTMNGGAVRYSEGGYSSPETYIANNFHSNPNYRAEGRLMTYQDSCRFPK
ncbi:hypothetical protein P3X46_016749 [Hevea brasiliensis]|uniref:Uncharacterized protein n=1 Tax=Hevea brasiliensis TaxID=3981 RepID=A0ABQ9M429_HEVBR|nr:uncharacterized protein LOC110658454 [Hevea brasiliensis]KAJ9173633.1 hypothetical protein P3X46_016749 [Hevea brasiliensis]